MCRHLLADSMHRVGQWRGRIAAACIVAVCVAASSHAAVTEPATVWAGDADAPIPGTLAGGRVIHARALARLIKRKDPVVIDVSNEPRRPAQLAPGAPWLPVPHRALPAARWIAGVGAGAIPPQLEQEFRRQLALFVGEDTHRALVFYCHARCWLSWNAAKRAIGYGYKQVFWFPDGIEGWNAAGLPTTQVSAEPTPESTVVDDSVPKPRLAVLPLELAGDLGGPDFAAEHAARLEVETSRLRQDLAAARLYEVLDEGAVQADIDRLKSQQLYLHDCNGCDLEIGRKLKADFVMVAWVYRVSGLILTLSYEMHSVAEGQIVARRSYDFRGDNDAAWNHAIDYMVRHLQEDSASPAH
jgi:PQQ-dependent catabolism-associated CXXCW motif protein